MSGSPARFNCQDCAILLVPKLTVSDKNGNKGRLFISCSGTLQSPHIPFFRFVDDPRPSLPMQAQPAHDTYPRPSLANRTRFQPEPPVEQGRCAAAGCTKRRVNIKCARGACATHCRAMGGCSVNLHQPEGTASFPSSSQSFETAPIQSQSQPHLTTYHMATPIFTPLQIDPPFPPTLPSSIQTGSHSIIEIQPPPAPLVTPLSAIHASQVLLLPAVPSTVSLQIVAEPPSEPPSSMNPLPNPRFASQMRPIFTTQSSREQEMRENVRVANEQRLDGTKKVKHTVTVCAWLADNEGPEESVHQGGFVWPNFCLSSSVLADAGFQITDENTWYHLYNRSRRSWQRVKANYFLSVETTTEILVKAVDVRDCLRLDEYLAGGAKPADQPHFRNNLLGERASVKAKVDREFLDLNSSPGRPSSTSKPKVKRGCNVASASKQLAPSRDPVNTKTTLIGHSGSSTKAISVSSSSPLPVQATSSPCDIINITDSDSSDIYWKPPKRRKLAASVGIHSRAVLQTVVKKERSPSLVPAASSGEERQWPSDYPVRDVVHVLYSCKPPPLKITVAQHFYSLTGIPFKSSTYYDTWSKWDNATQEQRDGVEECGNGDLWEDFAIQVPLKKTKLKVARQCFCRRQCTVEPEGSNGDTNSYVSSDEFDAASSD